MSEISTIADRHGVVAIEDAAHAVGAGYAGRPLGSFGQLAALSFHETKNLSCGEGGALIVNDAALKERAEIIREYGTSRAAFRRGDAPLYTWLALGTHDMLAQLECAASVTAARRALWQRYYDELEALAATKNIVLPGITDGADHNAHIFYVICPSAEATARLQSSLAVEGIEAATHFVPLHLTPAGQTYGRSPAPLPITEALAPRLLRLPLYVGLSEHDQASVIAQV
jgi:dTDP-4-amino-4,6-dideoxygalactose transaminase